MQYFFKIEVNTKATVGNNLVVLEKIKHRITISFSNSTSGYIHKRNSNRDWNTHILIFITALFTIAEIETT